MVHPCAVNCQSGSLRSRFQGYGCWKGSYVPEKISNTSSIWSSLNALLARQPSWTQEHLLSVLSTSRNA